MLYTLQLPLILWEQDKITFPVSIVVHLAVSTNRSGGKRDRKDFLQLPTPDARTGGTKEKDKKTQREKTVAHLAASATRTGTVTVISVNEDEDISLPSLWQGEVMTTARNRQGTEPTCTAHTEATSKKENNTWTEMKRERV